MSTRTTRLASRGAQDPLPVTASRPTRSRPATSSSAGGWSLTDISLTPSPASTAAVGAANDVAEHEAEGMAARALGLPPGYAQRGTAGSAAGGMAAPREVVAVTQAPGQLLPAGLDVALGRRFGFDFSQVQIHDGPQADRAARTLGADAYSLGSHLVFRDGHYAPGTTAGQLLLAHELAHVVQHGRGAGAAPVIRRSLAGALTGAGIGAAILGTGLGLLGSLLGPAGAVLGGIVGGLAGAALGGWLGDRQSSQARKLSQPEKDYARVIYRNSVDLDAVELRRDSVLSSGNTPRTVGNTINLPDSYFVGGTLELAQASLLVVIHELGHVWQYQHGGYAYIPSSLLPQAAAGLRGQSRNVAYDWRSADTNHIPWEEWNAEQQAECISDYNEALRRIINNTYTLADCETVVQAEPYIAKVHAGVGAPGNRGTPASSGPAAAPAHP